MKRICCYLSFSLLVASCQVNIQPDNNAYAKPGNTMNKDEDDGFPEDELQKIVAKQANAIAQRNAKPHVTAECSLPLQKLSVDEYIVDGTYTLHDDTDRIITYSCNMQLKRGGTLVYAEDWQCTQFYVDGKRKSVIKQ